MAMLRIELLGGLELIGANGAPITVSARKVAALAAYLAMVRRPQGRDALAAMFWGDRAEEQARMSLRQALSALRKALVFAHHRRVAIALCNDVDDVMQLALDVFWNGAAVICISPPNDGAVLLESCERITTRKYLNDVDQKFLRLLRDAFDFFFEVVIRMRRCSVHCTRCLRLRISFD